MALLILITLFFVTGLNPLMAFLANWILPYI